MRVCKKVESRYIKPCPICTESMVLPIGPEDAKGMVLTYEPTDDDISYGMLFTEKSSRPDWQQTTPLGQILRIELRRVGINFNELRICSLWMHKATDDEDCYKIHLANALKEAQKRKVVLMFDSGCTQVFLNANVQDVTGLKVKSVLLPKVNIVAAPNPQILFYGMAGEFQLSLQKFASYYRKIKK